MTETQKCLQCSCEYIQQGQELFCSDDCRVFYWRTKDIKNYNKNYTTDIQISDLKDIMQKCRANGNSIRKHLERIENDYSDWEDRVVAIENKLQDLEAQVGIEEEKLLKQDFIEPAEAKFDPIEDLLRVIDG